MIQDLPGTPIKEPQWLHAERSHTLKTSDPSKDIIIRHDGLHYQLSILLDQDETAFRHLHAPATSDLLEEALTGMRHILSVFGNADYTLISDTDRNTGKPIRDHIILFHRMPNHHPILDEIAAVLNDNLTVQPASKPQVKAILKALINNPDTHQPEQDPDAHTAEPTNR